MRTREYIENGESEGKSLIDAMEQGDQDGMQTFDTVIENFIPRGCSEYRRSVAVCDESKQSATEDCGS